mgnify:CR=1 FL=1
MTAEPAQDPALESAGEPQQPAVDPYWIEQLRWLFDFDQLRVRQKIIAIAQKYTVMDGAGYPRFFVVRPPRLAINIALNFLFGAVNIALFVLAIRLYMANGPGAIPWILALLIVGGNLLGFGRMLAAP